MTMEELEKELAELKRLLKTVRNRKYDTSEQVQRIQDRIKNTKQMIEKLKSDEAQRKLERFVSF